MKKAKVKHPSQVNLLAFVQKMEDRIPLSPEEAALYLPSPERIAASLKKVMDMADAEEAKLAQQQLDLGRKAREAAVEKIRSATVHRSRAESLAIIAHLKARPGFGNVMAFHRNFQAMTEADLDILVAELQALEASK